MPTGSGLSMPLLPPPDAGSDNRAHYEAHAGASYQHVAMSRLESGGLDIEVTPPFGSNGEEPLLFRLHMPFTCEVTFLSAGILHEALGGFLPEVDSVLVHLGVDYAALDRLLSDGVPTPAAVLLEGVDRDAFQADVEGWVADPLAISPALKDEAWYRVHGRRINEENPAPSAEAVDANFVQAVMDGLLYVWTGAETPVGKLIDISAGPPDSPSGLASLRIRAFDAATQETEAAWLLRAFGEMEPALAQHPLVAQATAITDGLPPAFAVRVQYFDVAGSVEGEFKPLVGAVVHVMDMYSEVSFAIGVTDANGVPAFSWTVDGPSGRSFYFRIYPPPGFEIILQDHELKQPRVLPTAEYPWETRFQWTDDGLPAWYEDFAGYRLGQREAPLVLSYGVALKLDLKFVAPNSTAMGVRYDRADSYSSQTRAFPRGFKVLAFQGGELADTFWTDSDGRVRGVSLSLHPDRDLDIAIESTVIDPAIGITDGFVALETFDPNDPMPEAFEPYVFRSSTMAPFGTAHYVSMALCDVMSVTGLMQFDWRLTGDETLGSMDLDVAVIQALANNRRIHEALHGLLLGEPLASVLPTRNYIMLEYGEGAEPGADARRVQARSEVRVPLEHPVAGVPIYCSLNRFHEDRWWDAPTAAHEYGHAVYHQLVGFTNPGGNPDLPTGTNYYLRGEGYAENHWNFLVTNDYTALVEGYAEAMGYMFGWSPDWPRLTTSPSSLPYKERVHVDLLGEAPWTAARRLCQEDGREVEGCVAEVMWAAVGDPRGDLGLGSQLPHIALNDGLLASDSHNPTLLSVYPMLGDATVRQQFRAMYWRSVVAMGLKTLGEWTGRTSGGGRFPIPYDYLLYAKAELDALHAAGGFAGPTYAAWKSNVLVPWHMEYTTDTTDVDTDAELVTC